MSNLAKSTKTQLIADYPKLGLKMSMTKDEMINKIETKAPKASASKSPKKGEY